MFNHCTVNVGIYIGKLFFVTDNDHDHELQIASENYILNCQSHKDEIIMHEHLYT